MEATLKVEVILIGRIRDPWRGAGGGEDGEDLGAAPGGGEPQGQRAALPGLGGSEPGELKTGR